MAKIVPMWQFRVKNKINKFILDNVNWKNRKRIEKFMKWLRDKGHIVFYGITPCYVNSKHEYREIDDDRYYDMIDLDVVNLFTGEQYTLTEME